VIELEVAEADVGKKLSAGKGATCVRCELLSAAGVRRGSDNTLDVIDQRRRGLGTGPFAILNKWRVLLRWPGW